MSSSSSSLSSSLHIPSTPEYFYGSSSESIENEIVSSYKEVVEMMKNTVESSTVKQKRKIINRNRIASHDKLVHDYFADDAVFDTNHFTRRFRMRRDLFLRIVGDIETSTPYFQDDYDERGRKSFTPLQKCTSAIRQLAYGGAPDMLDEYLHMSDKTSRLSLQRFCKAVIRLYGKEYLRKPTLVDKQRLFAAHSAIHGFPGMLGSLDCTHWTWKNCPVAWRGQYTRGDHGYPTIMLEAVASYDTWIWHAFFGVAGSNNDINVLNQSPLFNDVLSSEEPELPFQVNGVTYNIGYYLGDEIYPNWATIVKSFPHPVDDKRIRFKTAQKSARKDVERAFGILQGKWQILDRPARAWHLNKIRNIMYACIILHNMILEKNGRAISILDDDNVLSPRSHVDVHVDDVYESRLRALHSNDTHQNLRTDLVEHISRTHIPKLDGPLSP